MAERIHGEGAGLDAFTIWVISERESFLHYAENISSVVLCCSGLGLRLRTMKM